MAPVDPGERVADLQVVVLEEVEAAALEAKAPIYGNSGRAVGRILRHIDPLIGRVVRAGFVEGRSGTQEGNHDLIHQVGPKGVRVVQSNTVGFGGRYRAVVSGEVGTAAKCRTTSIVVDKNVSEYGLFRAQIQIDAAQIHFIIDRARAQRHYASRRTYRHVLEKILGRCGDATRIDNIVRHAGGAPGGRERRAGNGVDR